jgi:hypothetical protein
VQAVYPDSVSGEKDMTDANGKMVFQSIDYGRMTPLICSALKGVIDRLDAIEAKL